jgi:hypothetical protein
VEVNKWQWKLRPVSSKHAGNAQTKCLIRIYISSIRVSRDLCVIDIRIAVKVFLTIYGLSVHIMASRARITIWPLHLAKSRKQRCRPKNEREAYAPS